jgi:predicted aconitase with swiveling domain
MAQGAAFANLPLIDRFDVDITSVIRTGERVAVDPANAQLKVV